MATLGYARVSTDEQNLDLQRDALLNAGCEQVFEDLGVSAIATTRPGFEAALAALRTGDTFIIWKMDRAFRSLLQALEALELFNGRGVSFLSITDHIDTKTPMGRCMYQVRNAFAELERSLISERTRAGLAVAKRNGIVLGRPRLLNAESIATARSILGEGTSMTVAALARQLEVSPRTLRRALLQEGVP